MLDQSGLRDRSLRAELAAQHDGGLDGLTTVAKEIDAGQIELIGDQAIAKSMQQWLGLSPFAKEKSRVAA